MSVVHRKLGGGVKRVGDGYVDKAITTGFNCAVWFESMPH